MNDEMTIKEAKEILRQNWEKGIDCPCCTQMVRLYKRQPYYVQALALINLYKLDKVEPGYYHITQIEKGIKKSGGGDFAKLHVFGLIVDRQNTDTKKRTSGMWAITDKGRAFVAGTTTVPKYARIFNRKYYDVSKELVTIKDMLGSEFNYQELMGEYYRDKPTQASLL